LFCFFTPSLPSSFHSGHQKNFKDANLQDVARQKADAARHAGEPKETDQPKYRDRASERRIMHNQPDVPIPDNGSKPSKKKITEGPPPPPSPPPPPVTPGQDQNNVGNKLLKMMGWKEGTGLGSTGEGRVDPMYVAVSVVVCLNVNPLQSNSDLRARGWFGS
jgi:RNA-binding protein 5/10